MGASASTRDEIVHFECYQDGKPTPDFVTTAKGLKVCFYKWEIVNDGTVNDGRTSIGKADEISTQTDVNLIAQNAKKSGSRPRGAILLVHGICSHTRFEWLLNTACDEYEKSGKITEPITTSTYKQVYENSWIHRFNKKGFDCYGIDLEGHGCSQSWNSMRCNVCEFDDFAKNVLLVAEQIRNVYMKTYANETIPIFLMGISMGGAVSARAVELSFKTDDGILQYTEYSEDIKQKNTQDTNTHVHASGQRKDPIFSGCILLAPMLSVEKLKQKPSNRILLPLMNVVSKYAPNLCLVEKEENAMYPFIEELVKCDPLCYNGKLRVRIAAESVKVIDKIHAEVGSIQKTAFYLLHSKNDTMTDPDGSMAFHRDLGVQDKKIELLDTMWHYLTKEPDNGVLHDKISDWLVQRAPMQ